MDGRRPAPDTAAVAPEVGPSGRRGGGRRPTAEGERWAALFLLALLLFSPPILSIFSGHQLLAVPFVYVYLFAAWGLVIALLAAAAEGGSRGAPAETAAPGTRGSAPVGEE